MGKLTLVAASELAEGEDIREIWRLDASGKGVTHVEDLSPCVELTKLNLSKNSIENLGGLDFMRLCRGEDPHDIVTVCCKSLTWLDLSHNQLDSLIGIEALSNLAVLSASCNAITTCGDLSSLKNLKALILSSNRLSGLTGLSALKDLNTLVLSHNCFKSISVEKLTKLAKLSLSHNSLRAIPNVEHNSELRELRLNGNRIASVPESLRHNSRLALLDLGNNKIRDLSLLDVLRHLRSLKNLNLKGNKLCDSDDYQEKVLDAIRSVQVLDCRKRATIVVLGGGKRKPLGVKPGILKVSPSLKHPMKPAGGNTVGTEAVKKKVHFDEPHSKETRPKKKRKRRHEEEGDECETPEGIVRVEDGEPAAKSKKRKRKCEDPEDCFLGGTPKQKKQRVGRGDSEAAASSVKLKKHIRKKKRVPGFRVDVGGHDPALLSVSNGKRKHKQCGPQSKRRDVEEDATIPSSSSLAIHKAVVTSQCEEPGLVPKSRKGKKSNVKMHSGVVLTERVKFCHRKKKRGHGYAPTDFSPGAQQVEIGVGQDSTWTCI